MKKTLILLFTIFSFNVTSAPSNGDENAYASDLVKIEDFLPSERRYNISYGASVSKSSSEDGRSGYYLTQITPNLFIIDRTYIKTRENIEKISPYATISFGLTDGTSIAGTVRGSYHQTESTTDNHDAKVKKSSSIDNVNISLRKKTSLASDYSIFSGSIGYGSENLKSLSLGFSMNWIYDPVILGLSVSGNQSISDNSKFSIVNSSGTISLAVTPELSLRWGVNKSVELNNTSYSNYKTSSDLILGTTIKLTEKLTSDISMFSSLDSGDSSIINIVFSQPI